MYKPGEMNLAPEPTRSLVPVWLQKVKEECEDEASKEQHHEVEVLKDGTREALWLVCLLLGVEKRGVPGHASQLLERCITHQTEIFSFFDRGSKMFHALEYQELLIMTTCVKLSAKKFLTNPNLSTKVVCKLLRLNDITEEELNAMEFHILKILKFTLPLWTSVDVAQLLAYAIGMSEPHMAKVEIIMDLAEFRRHRINGEARDAAGLSLSPSGKYVNKTVRSLHLAAGVVLALMQYHELHDVQREEKLAILTSAPLPYLKCLSLIILKYYRESISNAEQFRERKHDE